jgi:hypothetical protein
LICSIQLPLFVTVQKIIYPLFDQLSKSSAEGTVKLLLDLAPQIERVIVDHYFPYLKTLIQTHTTKTTKGETVLLTALTMIEGLLHSLPPKTGWKSFSYIFMYFW